MKEIALSKGKSTVVDDCDYDYLVSLGKWCADKRSGTIESYYAYKKINKITVRMHRLIMECAVGPMPKENFVDHIDGNGLNNCRSNLRICVNKQNVSNQRKANINSTSKYKGVAWHKGAGKWMAQISPEGKHVYLGLFVLESQAAKAYNEAAVQYFGKFAKLNVIE